MLLYYSDQFRFWIANLLNWQRKPKILVLADKRSWAFANSVRQIAYHLRDDFIFDVRYVHEAPRLSSKQYDLVYICFWGENYHHAFGFDADRTIKEVSSHRWQDDPRYGPCLPFEMVEKYLSDSGTVICTSQRLFKMIQAYHPRVFYTPNGIDSSRFRRVRNRSGALAIGWAGDINDPVKGVNDILRPACKEHFKLLLASGGLSYEAMNEFYNRLDIFAVASKHEGEPLTLLEAMAAGCFPVCTDVGVVPELVRHGENGLILHERTVEKFRAAFEWCQENLELVRVAGTQNAETLREQRGWQRCAQTYGQVFQHSLAYARRPRFRNDDVSADTCLQRFGEFCDIFRKYGIQQVHGVTLRGRTSSYFTHNGEPAEYDGWPSLSVLSNDAIRKLSDDLRLEEQENLVAYLRRCPDEIALHGLYHTDYSVMNGLEQRHEIAKALKLLAKLFPRKKVRYFIAPFNRTNQYTYKVASEFGLQVLAADGVHMEVCLNNLHLEPETWYRYHHHRFYPESTYRYSKLSFDALDTALARNRSKR
jgi:glycosyltransferase involved in cell wall biosynthesis